MSKQELIDTVKEAFGVTLANSGLTMDDIFERGPSPEEARIRELDDKLSHLDKINYEIAQLRGIKEKLESRVKELFNHEKIGQSTYRHGKYGVVITTGYNYKLNKSEYEVMKGFIPAEFNPVVVTEKVEYKVNPSLYKHAEEYADNETLRLLSELMPKEDSKLNVVLKAAV